MSFTPEYDAAHKIGKRDDGTCECGAGDDNAEHVLFQCVTYENERREAQDQLRRVGDTWPTTLEEVTALAGSRTWWMALTRVVTGSRDHLELADNNVATID
ncbi:hypothetical protein CBL_08563 [Carabus blaptoides fortunei]